MKRILFMDLDGLLHFKDLANPVVECWQHAARLVGCLEDFESHAPCNRFCAALEIDGRSVRCNSMGAEIGEFLKEE